MPKFKNQSTLQRIFLGKHDRSLGFADIDIPMLFISTFLLFFGIVMVTSVSLPLFRVAQHDFKSYSKNFHCVCYCIICFQNANELLAKKFNLFLIVLFTFIDIGFCPFYRKRS